MLKVAPLREFSEALRLQCGLLDSLTGIALQYGRPSQAAFDATHSLTWNGSGTLATRPCDEDDEDPSWDHEEHGPARWAELWPAERSRFVSTLLRTGRSGQTLHRAWISLGSLTDESSTQLGASDPADPASAWAPDAMSIEIGPLRARTLRTQPSEDGLELCHGALAVALSGNGYFTWQPIQKYWEAIRSAAVVQETLRLCREHFPVPAALTREAIIEALGGEPFLNADEYQAGDWVVTLSETG